MNTNSTKMEIYTTNQLYLLHIIMKTLKISLQKAQELYGKEDTMDQLLLETFTKDELEPKPAFPEWINLDFKKGFYISNLSEIIDADITNVGQCWKDTNMFATKAQAKSALAMAQLSQLMKHVNKGWEPDWTDGNTKYCLRAENGKLSIRRCLGTHFFLAFRDEETMKGFLNAYEDLIKEYFMID